MSVSPDVRVVTDIPAVDPAFVTRLKGLDLPMFGHLLEQGFARGIRCIANARELVVGRVVTVKLITTDSRLVHYSTKVVGPGDFVIIDNGHNTTHASVGGGVVGAYAARGVVGVAVAGTVTDVVELRESGVAVFATDLAPLTTRNSAGPIQGSINVPVSIGGVTATPGMIALGDENGLLIAEPNVLASVADRVQAMLAWEPDVMSRVRSGETLADVILDADDLRELDARANGGAGR